MTLTEFFKENPRAALGFSGGVDSAYLLYAARAAGAKVTAYYVQTPFQPAFELAHARRLAGELGAELRVIPLDILKDEAIAANPPDRCYHCKKRLFGAVAAAARADGYTLLLDGTNASDQAADRPGMKALAQLGVRSPLREAGLTKEMIRTLSRQAGLFTWNKPAYACLATRVPTGRAIAQRDLERVEKGENALYELGFRDVRLRLEGSGARLELPCGQWGSLLENRSRILKELKPYFDKISLDLEGRQNGAASAGTAAGPGGQRADLGGTGHAGPSAGPF